MLKPLVMIVCLVLLSAHDLLAQESHEVAAIVDALGKRAIEVDGVVGLSMGVARNGELQYARGFGLANVELNVPVTAETVFRIGSISKEFTAAAVLLLVEDGKIKLDDPLTKFIPDYPKTEPPVLIRHLLHHTSGVRDFTRLPTFRKDRASTVTAADVIERFRDLPVNFAAGDKYSYCNSGYFLLGAVIEKASGKSYNEFVGTRILEPVKLRQTWCDDDATVIPLRAAGYTNWGGKLKNAPHININQTVGAGSMASTVKDLLVWQHALASEKVLPRDSTRLMTSRGTLNNGNSFNYGLGIFIQDTNGRRVLRHGGGISGFRAEARHYPTDAKDLKDPPAEWTIAILANCENANTSRYANQIAAAIFLKEMKEKQ